MCDQHVSRKCTPELCEAYKIGKCNGPEPDDPLKHWKMHPVQKKHKDMEFIEETMR